MLAGNKSNIFIMLPATGCHTMSPWVRPLALRPYFSISLPNIQFN